MNIEQYRDYCIDKKGVTDSFPFDEKTLVFKVMNKMFAHTSIEEFNFVNLKCNPEKSIELRDENDGIIGAYHMSKKHWNSVSTTSHVSEKQIYQLIDHSYDLVTGSLTKQAQKELEEL